ncbi:MAG: hypothetical protein NUW01_05950 [Gemmatimonadaceae bacterium]|nr:hypothetical protein [Gemmatimonadaceae bacterium]
MMPRTTLAVLRLEAARLASMAFDGSCSALGTTSTLIDAALRDVGVDTAFLQAAWMYRPDAAAAGDMTRAVQDAGFTVASGTLAPVRAWTNAPASAEAYQIYSIIPPVDVPGIPVSWDRAITAGLARCYFTDEIVIGRGTSKGDRRFPITRSEVTQIAVIAVAGGTNATITQPTGWTLVLRTNTGTDLALGIYRKRAAAGDDAAETWTFDESRAAAGIVAHYADANPSAPVDASGGNATTPTSATATAPTVTTTVADARVLRIFAALTASVVLKPDVDALHERADVVSADPAATIGLALMDIEQGNAAATGTQAATLGTSSINIGATVALKPLGTFRDIAFVAARESQNGAGATTLTTYRPSSLPNDDWLPDEDSARAVYTRNVDASPLVSGTDWSRGGRWWRVMTDGPRVELRLGPGAPSQAQEIILEVHRPFPALVDDADETECALNVAARAAVWQAFEMLNAAPVTRGQYASEVGYWRGEWEAVYKPPASVVVV